MKKALFGFILAFSFLIAPSTIFAEDIQIKIDDVAIASDTLPEIKNNRTMVPLRVISESLGASIEWSKSQVVIAKDDIKVIIKVNSRTAEKNGEQVLLDVKPYIKNDRIFVPLRFIAETFECKVNYSNFVVSVDTKPLVIDGVQVKAQVTKHSGFMDLFIQQVNGNMYNEAIYHIFVNSRGKQVEAPVKYAWTPDLDHVELFGYYYQSNGQYDFLDAEGNSIARYDIYSLMGKMPSDSEYTEILLHDVSKDSWYTFSGIARQSIDQLLDKASENGFIKIIPWE